MATIEVHAGDFLPGHTDCSWNVFTLKTEKHKWVGEHIKFKKLQSVTIATEENVKELAGTLGYGAGLGAVGALFGGPVGLLLGAGIGAMLGGKKKNVTFIAVFKDGRKMMATTSNKVFVAMQAAVF